MDYTKAINLLVIEDNPADQILLQEYISSLDEQNYNMTFSSTIAEARSQLNHTTYDIILTDYSLPDGTGPEFIQDIKESVSTPFIVLTGHKDPDIEKQVLASGASDFIPKNEISASFLERVIHFSIERYKTHALLKEQTLRDPLTGLYNRLGMENLLSKNLTEARQHHKPFALLLIDIDRFKTINDTYGHATGDKILKLIAETLTTHTRCSRKKDFAIRIGGDEFALLATELEHIDNVYLIIERITQNLTKSFEIEGYDIAVAFSIGVAIYPDDGLEQDELINSANFSLYHAKTKTGTTFEFFDKSKHKKIQKKNYIENSLSQAIHDEQFMLHYQPKISLQTDTVQGCEALIRWNHPEKGMIWPREFVHITEETGHILQIGEWALREACTQCATWQQQMSKPISISVNVSIRQLLHNSFVDMVKSVLKDAKLDPKYLELEITESLLIKNLNQGIKALRKLRRMGIAVSLDDFGTGYSSLSRLRKLPLDKIKIDRSLIRKVGRNKFDSAIAKTVLSLAKNLNLTAIAEGVETEEQYRFLKNAACPEIQGYYFSRPLPANEFAEKFLKTARVSNASDAYSCPPNSAVAS